jgi:hypothetical protein
MQTALAVREMIFTSTDVVIGISVYFVTIDWCWRAILTCA